MTHSFKRILSLVLTLAMVLSCVPAQALATEDCGHTYSVTTTEPNCTEDGTIDFVCTLCGDSYSEPGAAAEGHDYNETAAVDATCAEAGSVTYTCSVCEDVYEDEILATGEHAYVEGFCACGAEDPNAAPAEEPTEAPAEPALELTEASAPQANAGVLDGENVPPTVDSVVKLVGNGETREYTTLEEAVENAREMEQSQITLLEDCVVEKTILIDAGIRIINEADKDYSITAADGVDAIFEIGENGDLKLENVELVANGKYAIKLTAGNAIAFLMCCDVSGATEAAINLEDVPYTHEEFQNVQIYSGVISGATALNIAGSNAQVGVAMGNQSNPPATLSANSTAGAIVVEGDEHDIQLYGTVITNDGVAFTMNGDSKVMVAGVDFNGTIYDNPWETPIPQNGAVARTDIGYYGSLQSALDAATEMHYNIGDGMDTNEYPIPLTVLEPLTISETITLEETEFPVAMRGEDITLTEDGVFHIQSHLKLENYIYMGLGTVYVPEGGELEWAGGDVIGHVTWSDETADHISAYWVHDQGEGWFENLHQYHPNMDSIRMVPGQDHFLIFYKNIWDADNGKWTRTSVAPGDLNLPENLTVNPLSDYDWIEFREGEANAENFVDLIVEPEMPWDTHPVITVDGIPFTVNVERDANHGFYSAPEAKNENWLNDYRYNKFRPEDTFYFIFTADGFTLESISVETDMATVEATDDPNVYKITLTDDARALDESIHNYHDFDINVNMVAKDRSGNTHYWGYNIYCEPWIWNFVDGAEMSHADLMFVIDAQQNVNNWAGAWIHESVTTLDPNVNNGILDIDMGVREDDDYERVFVLEDAGKIIVPDGCTLIINSRTAVAGGLIEVQDGGKLIINTILHAGTGTIYLHDDAELEDNFGLRMTPMTWESDAKEDFISAANANAENNVFYATIDEFDNPSFREYQMLPGYGKSLVFYYNHWNGTQWEITPIHPDDLTTDDGLAITGIDEVGGTVRDDQEYGDCFAMLWAKEDEDLWDTIQNVYYRDCSFPVRLQRDQDMGFYSAPEVSNETFLDSFGFGPDRNTFYFIVTDENLTANSVTAQIEEGPHMVEGGVIVTEYADNIWKIELEDHIVANMNRNFWLRVRVELEDANGNVWRTDRGMDCHPWTWNMGMPDAGFEINGRWHEYYADADTYMAWIEDESYEYGGYRGEVELPAGVSYDIGTNTMTLNNATIDTLSVHYHWQGEDDQGNFQEGWDLPNADFTLKLIGENRIGDGSTTALWLGNELNATITGNGSLYVYNNNENPKQYNCNAAEIYDCNLTIGGSAKVTFHVEGENYWDNGDPAWMHGLMGSPTSTLLITDSATLTMEVPELRHDETPGAFGGGYRGMENFREVTVEKQATVNLDSLHLSDGEMNGESYTMKFVQRGGTVNINAKPNKLLNEDNGGIRYHYEPVNVIGRSLLQIEGGKMNINVVNNTDEDARYNGIFIDNASLYIFGGNITVNTNVLGPAIYLGGENHSWLYMGGGTLTYHDNYAGEEKNALIITDENARARFYGGTIVANGGVMNFRGLAPEGEMKAITWNGTNFRGNDANININGDFQMDSGLIELNDGLMQVHSNAYFEGGTLNMNDSVMIVNGEVYAQGNSNINFEMKKGQEANTAIEIHNFFRVNGEAQLNINIALENITYENGDNIRFSGIRNHATFEQLDGTVNINSNAKWECYSSSGDTFLHNGEMNLAGYAGIEQGFAEDNNNIFQMMEGMTLNVDVTRCGVALSNAEIMGGSMNIVADGSNGTFGLYSLPGATMHITGGMHNIEAHSTGENTIGAGLLADGSEINIVDDAVVYIEADQAMVCWMMQPDVYTTINTSITDSDTGDTLSSWYVEEDGGNEGTYNSFLTQVNGKAATNVCANKDAEPKTLQELLSVMAPNNGRYTLAQSVLVNESMRLEDENGDPIMLEVIRGGKITVRSGAVLTIPSGSILVAYNNREENNDLPDGTIIVDAGGQILNNGMLVNDGGYISIQSTSTKSGYIHGANAQVIATMAKGEISPVYGVAERYQQVETYIGDKDQLAYALNEIRDYSQDGEKIRYSQVYLWTDSSMNLDGLVIPENTDLSIDGQGTTAVLTLSEGAVLVNSGSLNLGNVNLTVDGKLTNFGIIQTDIHDNAQITINGEYFAGDGAELNLNRADVTVNGEFALNAENSSMFIHDGSVVDVSENGIVVVKGALHVGQWKQSHEETENYADVAGTLNVAGQIDVYNYLSVASETETSGGIVNVENGGIINECVDEGDGWYGYIDVDGEMNVKTGGVLSIDNDMGISGTLNVEGDLYNRGRMGLLGELNIFGNLHILVEADEYYAYIDILEDENGNGGKLIASDGATIYNDGSISNLSRNGIFDVTKANFEFNWETAEVCRTWFDNGDIAVCDGIDENIIFLVYEGDNAASAKNMAHFSDEHGYRGSIVLVADYMHIGDSQDLDCNYLIVKQDGELEVDGYVNVRERLNIRAGGKLSIGTYGWVVSETEMNAFAGNEGWPASVIENRGGLECSSNGYMCIDGEYHDFGVGTIYNIMMDGSQANIFGDAYNIGADAQTLFTSVVGEDGEQKLRDIIDMSQQEGYGYTIINVLTDIAVTYDLYVPENVRIRLTSDKGNIGSLTVHNNAFVNNAGKIVNDQPYAALKAVWGSYGGSGEYYGYCGTGDENEREELMWSLKNGTMTISGYGSMADYTYDTPAPWLNLNVGKVILGVGVIRIGDYAFQKVNASVIVPKSLQYFGTYCFGGGMDVKVYHNSAAEAYLAENYAGKWNYIHELVAGVCIVEGCGYGLNDLLNNSNTSAEEKKEELKNVDTESLKQEMEKNEAVVEQLEQLEQDIIAENELNISVSVGVEEGVEDIISEAFGSVDEDASIVGAILNAEENISEVKLVLGNPETADIKDEKFEQFNTDASVLFSMTMEGVGNASSLDIPVKITLPVPANVQDLSKLVVMHYHDGNEDGERLQYTLSTDAGGKAYVTFILSGFSDFLIGEDATPVIVTAKVDKKAEATVTTGTDIDDVPITITTRDKQNKLVTDLNTGYTITDGEGNEVNLEEALQNEGEYLITPTYEKQSKYTVETVSAKLTVNPVVYVCMNATSETNYESVSEALNAAVPGETVRLTQNYTEKNEIILRSGVTLDVGKYTLTAENHFVGLDGSYLDGDPFDIDGTYGKIITEKSFTMLTDGSYVDEKNYSILPVYYNDGYVFTRMEVNTDRKKEEARGLTVDTENKQIKFQFVTNMTGDVRTNILNDGVTGNKVKIVVRLEWEVVGGDDIAYQDFVYNDGQIAKICSGGSDFTFTMVGYDALNIDLSTLKVMGIVKSDCGVTEYGTSWNLPS